MNNKNNVARDYERGTRIVNRRKELGLTQDELAYQIGIGRQALSAIENGGAFKTNTLDKLVDVLGVNNIDEIVRRIERVFRNKSFLNEAERSKKNWTDLSTGEVLEKDIEFVKTLK